MKKHSQLLLIALAAVGAILPTGCSLIGYGIGKSLDKAPNEYVFPSDVESIKNGTKVEVTKIDSSRVSGKFAGLELADSGEYRLRYQQFVNSHTVGKLMPALGDSIVLVKHELSGRKELRGVLVGFESNRMRMWMPRWNRQAAFYVNSGDTVSDGEAATIDGDTLRRHLKNREIPSMSTVVITTDKDKLRIFLDDIALVHQSTSQNGKWWGLALGIAVDVAVLIFASSGYTLFPKDMEFN